MNAALPKEGFAFVHLMEGLLLVLLITRPSRAVINLNVCCEKRALCTESVYTLLFSAPCIIKTLLIPAGKKCCSRLWKL